MILGKSNDAPIYKPMPGTVPFTDQVNRMKDNWVKTQEDQLTFLFVWNGLLTGCVLLIILIMLYGRF